MKIDIIQHYGAIVVKPRVVLPSIIPKQQRVSIIFNKTKEYPTMFKISLFKEPRIYSNPLRSVKRNPHDVDKFEPTVSSLSRTKRTISDIVLCNDFDLFATFTFDPKKNNRYDYNHCLSIMRSWLHKRKSFDKDFAYLVIPEFHKDGAIHFHALFSHFKGSMRDSHHFSPSGSPIYNITCFRSGFTTACPIRDRAGVAKYVQKYITKDFIKRYNRRRFFCSSNLRRPIC